MQGVQHAAERRRVTGHDARVLLVEGLGVVDLRDEGQAGDLVLLAALKNGSSRNPVTTRLGALV
jgi:hypothetical protein